MQNQKEKKKTAESFSELCVVVFDAVGDVGTIVRHRNWTAQPVESTSIKDGSCLCVVKSYSELLCYNQGSR